MNLSEQLSSPLPQMLNIIDKAEAPEAVFLLAHRTSHTVHHNPFFVVPQTTNTPSAFFLLLVIATDAKTCAGIQSRLENLLQPVAETTVWCIPLIAFNENLASGDYFAITVLREADRLHYAEDAEIIPPLAAGKGLEYTSRWYERALEFWAGSELYSVRKQYAMAAFHLHQCAEQALTSIIYNRCGYRPSTHNLSLLFRYAVWMAPELAPLFTTGYEKDSLQLLQKTYTDSRYNNDYTVKAKQLEEWKEKITALLEGAKRPVRKNILQQLTEAG